MDRLTRRAPSLLLVLAGLITATLAPPAHAQPVAQLRECSEWMERAVGLIVPVPEDPQLVSYRRSYQRVLDSGRPVRSTRVALERRLKTARAVLLGDQHSSERFQMEASAILEAMSRGEGKVTLVIEFIDARFQPLLDEYQAGRLPEEAFRKQAYEASHWSFPWPRYRAVLETARRLGAPVVAAEPGRERDLAERDREIAKKAAAIPGRILVWYGSLHILGTGHLADHLHPDLSIVGVGRSTYWKLAEHFGAAFEVADLRPDLVFVNLVSPLELAWVELDETLEQFGYAGLDQFVKSHPEAGELPPCRSDDPAHPTRSSLSLPPARAARPSPHP